MAVVLPDLLETEHVTLDLRAGTLEPALREIIGLLHASGAVRDAKAFLDRILTREQVNSTVMEHGVAFPHARTDLVDHIVLGIGRSAAGVPFAEPISKWAPGAGPPKGKRAARPSSPDPLAHLIFVIGVPRNLISDYLVCVGALDRLVKDDATRATLLDAKTPADFVEKLKSESLFLE